MTDTARPRRCWRCLDPHDGPGVCPACAKLLTWYRAGLAPDALPTADFFPDLPRRPRTPRAGETGELF
jgi:hypothetical protein